MNTPGERVGMLVLVGALAASAFACKGRAGSEPGGAPAPPAARTAAAATAAEPTPVVELWEPVDKNFTGCEGG